MISLAQWRERKVKMPEQISITPQNRDEQLFETLKRNKKRRKRRLWLTVTGIVLAVLLALGVTVRYLRGRVDSKFNSSNSKVLSYTAAPGSVSTTVSGTGILEDMDLEELKVPASVKVDEVLVSANDAVKAGDMIARIDMPSVLSAMSEAQAALDAFDAQLSEAEDDAVESTVKAGVSGRVKAVYCAEGDVVADCMVQHGALVLLSTDGYMSASLPSFGLSRGDQITAEAGDGTRSDGFVESIDGDTAMLLIDDDSIGDGETVTILNADGGKLGTASASVHNPLRVTGFAGTVQSIPVSVGDRVFASTDVIRLSDTAYSANYESILRQRTDKEEELMSLLKLHRDGALLAPFSGTVNDVPEEEKTANPYFAAEPEEEQIVAVLSPDKKMSVTINVDESDILSLESGQEVELTVASIGEEPYPGVVSEINKTAVSAMGVTSYSAKIELDKQPRMLPGMSAKAVIRIQGVDDAIIIPVDALHQTSASAYVYTGYDEAAGEYTGKVEVTTGLSNANYVEIISGLSEGDVVYYTERRRSRFWGFGNFGGSSSSGWEIPEDYGNYQYSGGNMPSGGWNGGDFGANSQNWPGRPNG